TSHRHSHNPKSSIRSVYADRDLSRSSGKSVHFDLSKNSVRKISETLYDKYGRPLDSSSPSSSSSGSSSGSKKKDTLVVEININNSGKENSKVSVATSKSSLRSQYLQPDSRASSKRSMRLRNKAAKKAKKPAKKAAKSKKAKAAKKSGKSGRKSSKKVKSSRRK
ncbi:hypothetical protein PMAYCL1PPCAC_00661, partial [Pristionchus mayeri]